MEFLSTYPKQYGAYPFGVVRDVLWRTTKDGNWKFPHLKISTIDRIDCPHRFYQTMTEHGLIIAEWDRSELTDLGRRVRGVTRQRPLTDFDISSRRRWAKDAADEINADSRYALRVDRFGIFGDVLATRGYPVTRMDFYYQLSFKPEWNTPAVIKANFTPIIEHHQTHFPLDAVKSLSNVLARTLAFMGNGSTRTLFHDYVDFTYQYRRYNLLVEPLIGD